MGVRRCGFAALLVGPHVLKQALGLRSRLRGAPSVESQFLTGPSCPIVLHPSGYFCPTRAFVTVGIV